MTDDVISSRSINVADSRAGGRSSVGGRKEDGGAPPSVMSTTQCPRREERPGGTRSLRKEVVDPASTSPSAFRWISQFALEKEKPTR